MTKKYNYVLFHGRLQFPHKGHKHNIETALELSEVVMIGIGSPNRASSPRNPLYAEERIEVLTRMFPQEVADGRIHFLPIPDITYNDQAWVINTRKIITNFILDHGNAYGFQNHGLKDFNIGIIGYEKDASSSYLRMFHGWDLISLPSQHGTFNSTEIRDNYFQRTPIFPERVCPVEVVDYMEKFMYTDKFKWLLGEAEYYRDYKKSWEHSPYPVIIPCVDAVCVQNGQILLVTRGKRPGLGLLALPGGHVNPDETFRNAIIRELREETEIEDNRGKMPPAVLGAYIEDKMTRLFDDPWRSEKGRVTTNAYKFTFPDRDEPFKVLGADDAEFAQWYPLDSLDARDFFDDHAHIIREMTGVNID